MIHSARPTVPPVAKIIFTWKLFCEILKSGNGRTDDMFEDGDHYRPSWINKKLVGCLRKVNWPSRSNFLTYSVLTGISGGKKLKNIFGKVFRDYRYVIFLPRILWDKQVGILFSSENRPTDLLSWKVALIKPAIIKAH